MNLHEMTFWVVILRMRPKLQIKMLKQHLKMLKRVENKFLSYLASLAPEERERHIVDFHVTYARAIKPPIRKKSPTHQIQII